MKTADYKHFENLDIRVGTITEVVEFPKARIPAYKVEIDFGAEFGRLKSSAQITGLYKKEDLVGTQVLAVVNFPKKQIANFLSECLILGIYWKEGVVLLRPDKQCDNGLKVG